MTQNTATRPGIAQNIRELASRQKSSAGAPAYSRFVNRPLGRVFAAAAHTAGLTPNAVTGISALSTFTAIVLLATAPPTPLVALLVVVGLVLGYALDSADGQLARLRGGGSPAGEWLDHVVDATKQATLHVAVLIGWYRFYPVDDGALLIPIGFGVVASVFFFAIILSELLRRLHAESYANVQRSAFRNSPVYSLLVLPADYGFLCLVFALWAWPEAFVLVYGLFFVANVAVLLVSVPRWYRSMSRL